jgi:hypothetical protein
MNNYQGFFFSIVASEHLGQLAAYFVPRSNRQQNLLDAFGTFGLSQMFKLLIAKQH